jgi:uncharacterized SAM-binding protein YcdF (DUF218 family)
LRAARNGARRMLAKSIGSLFFPVPLICEILALGLVLLWFTRRQKAGKVLVTAAAVLLLLLGNTRISGKLLNGLERRYSPLEVTARAETPTSLQKGMFIVVLAGGYSSDSSVDLLSRLSEATLARLAEGILLYREVPGCKLLLSGGPPFQAESMANAALALGVPEQDIILEAESKNTEQEAVLIAPTVGKAPFALVTSASHMPRAMGLFRKLGMNPIAAPTDYLAKGKRELEPDNVFPGYYGLYESERAAYEYLGITWETLNHEM